MKKEYLKPKAEYINFYSEEITSDSWGDENDGGGLSGDFGLGDMESGDV